MMPENDGLEMIPGKVCLENDAWKWWHGNDGWLVVGDDGLFKPYWSYTHDPGIHMCVRVAIGNVHII